MAARTRSRSTAAHGVSGRSKGGVRPLLVRADAAAGADVAPGADASGLPRCAVPGTAGAPARSGGRALSRAPHQRIPATTATPSRAIGSAERRRVCRIRRLYRRVARAFKKSPCEEQDAGLATVLMESYAMLIDGRAVRVAEQDDVIDPAKGEPFATVPRATRAHVDDAVGAASRAYKTWRTDEAVRRRALGECAK